MARPYFEPVDPKINFPEMEKKILDYWYREGIIEKYLKKNKSSKNNFSFLDGPITANNPMGVHHAWGRTYKDLWQRFKNMQGYRERFQNGFDCQGLWVEVEVEKELGLKSKKEIENLVPGDKKASIAKFVNLCKERVKKYSTIQTEQTKRLGNFMDWDNSYFTMSDENNYMIWHFLKKCHEQGLIYKGRDSVPWCPRCGTAISQHEMLTEDYKEIIHESIYIKYPIVGKKNLFFLVWTTTPWTLPGNVAVAVDSEKDYVLAGTPDSVEKYYLIKEAAKRLNLKVEKTVKGKELIGLNYISPFDNLERIAKAFGNYRHQIVATDTRILPVVEGEGTGLINIAPGAGTEDFQLGKKLNLPVIELIDEEAAYLDGFGGFSGQNAKKHPEIIIDFVKNGENGIYFFKSERVTHRYPACWRCKTELVWRVVDEWYIAIDPVREDMKNVAKKINWIPKFGLKRELDWLENMHDWLISKKRYWGLALPIWECPDCQNFEVVGSYEELKDKAVAGWDRFEGYTPKKPWIDEIKIKCGKCGKEMTRVADVGNPWLDAGIVSFSTISADNESRPLYKVDRKEFEKWYPADFITESFPGQFKNWFYSLLAMSTVLEKKEPTKTILGFGTLFGEDGRPMHKSWGNAIEFNEGADKIGVDVMRWMFARQNPAENLLFGYKIADETRRKFHLIIWNIYNFFVTYANLDGWQPPKNLTDEKLKLSILDKWILSRLGETILDVTKLLEEYDAFKSAGAIENFVNDLSLWYIRRSRDRVGPCIEFRKDKNVFYYTTYVVLTTLSKLLAPFIPFMAETIYRNLTKENSIHLSSWPEKEWEIDEKLINEMSFLRAIIENIHSARKQEKIPVRQPLSEVVVYLQNSKQINNKILKIGLEEVNVKKISIKEGNDKVVLNTKITFLLAEEGKVRELIRKVQEERKKKGLNLTQKISISNIWVPQDKKQIQQILTKTLGTSLVKGDFGIKKA